MSFVVGGVLTLLFGASFLVGWLRGWSAHERKINKLLKGQALK